MLLAILCCGRLAEASTPPDVTLLQDRYNVTLSNGLLTAKIEKRSGSLTSLRFHEQELVAPGSGYWSFVGYSAKESRIAAFGRKRTFAVRTDPAANGGGRAEVACQCLYDGTPATLPMDVDLRWSLGRGESGLYAYAVWTHKPGQPALALGEARLALKLNPAVFDFLTIDARRRRPMASGYDWDHGTPLNLGEARRLTTGVRRGEVEHKYDYAAILAQTPAYGWSSTRYNVGLWMINPSLEYLLGGPTKVDLTGHLDGNKGGLPTLLSMWQGPHYGGRDICLADNEAWTKVVGPIFVYGNAAAGQEAMWHDALARADAERKAWPYAWPAEPNYPKAAQRGTVSGQLIVRDPQAPQTTAAGAWIGLATPAYTVNDPDGEPHALDWQSDGKHYQFWDRAGSDGRFTLRNVRPGTYTLYAFTDGVLGEFSRADIRVEAGRTCDLGPLVWTPTRYGRQLWEIGVPDRSAAEFRHGDEYWQWGLYLRYPQEFPNDVNFIIGKSDWRRDWNYCQPPRIEADGHSHDTTWSIAFDAAESPRGKAVLRLAICGSRSGGQVWGLLNGRRIGATGELPSSGVMHRDGIRGYWTERDLAFDAALIRRGQNTLQLRSRGDNWTRGVLYDYLRLEVP